MQATGFEILNEGKDFVAFRRLSSDEVPAPGGGVVAAPSSLEHLVDSACQDDVSVVLLGEVHDDNVAHALQLTFLQACEAVCEARGQTLILSLEMFEADVQRVLDEYVVHRSIREQDFLQDSRPWGNYKEHYRPLVEFCRDKGIRVVAANAPRRYVSLVARKGADALGKLFEADAESYDKLGLPPLPMPQPSPAYRQKFIETVASKMPPQPEPQQSGECPFIGFKSEDVKAARPEMMEAQQLWDHTMAKSVASLLNPIGVKAPFVVHICGAFHCSHGLGIPEVLGLYGGPSHGMAPSPLLEIDDSDIEIGFPEKVAGPQRCPPGVISVVCWPASVAQTCALVDVGKVPLSIGYMADWVIITEETFSDPK